MVRPTGPGGESARNDWAEMESIFHDCLAREGAEREAYLRERCADRPDLEGRVRALLAEDERSDSLLDRDMADVAGAILDGSVPALTEIGPYRVLRVLGKGGMGVVFLAERDDLGSRAAIKVLRDAALSPARRERFHFERRVLAKLEHPSIARLLDADALPDGTPYFVMEYVQGEPLDRYLAGRDLPVRERLALFRSICEAVRYAHGHAIIHRDLKPSNILVTSAGTVKLLDFGIAKPLEGVEPGQRLTRTGLSPMTPAFAAPEQILDEPIGVHTDVYALGGVLYLVLTGSAPFDLEALSPAQAERAIVETGPRPPSQGVPLAAGLTRTHRADLDTLCATAMHRSPERRYSSVEALVRDVDHFLADEPLEARPDSRPYRARKFARRHARALAVAGVVLLALVGTVTYYTYRLDRALTAAIAEASRARRIQAFTQSLFNGADDVAGPADTLRVVTLLERGAREASMLAAAPEEQAEMSLILGSIFAQVGEYDRADTLLLEAERILEGLPDLDVWTATAADVERGQLLVTLGDYEEALRILEPALGARTRASRSSDPRVATVAVTLAAALEGRGDYARAIELLNVAVRAFESDPALRADLSRTLTALANTHFYAGELEASDSLNRRSLEIDRTLHGDRHPSIAHGLINLSVLDFQRGRYDEAEPGLREAVDIFSEYYGDDHPQTGSSLRMLGRNLMYQDGRLDEAEDVLLRSLAISERWLEPDHPRIANVLGDLASVAVDRGRHAEAVESHRRIVEIYRSANGERHHFVAIGLSNLATALEAGGDVGQAEATYRDVIARFEESRGADDLDTGIARLKLGLLLFRQDRHAEAEDELLAGYGIVRPKTVPTIGWLADARGALVRIYEAAGEPERAAPFRAEQLAADSIEAGAGA